MFGTLVSTPAYASYGSAIAVAIGAGFAIRKYFFDRRAAETAALRSLLAEQPPEFWQVLREVTDTAARDPWIVLTAERDRCAWGLSVLDRMARQCGARHAWHGVLDGFQFGLLDSFLRAARPLVLVIRRSGLRLDGPYRPYNGTKGRCAEAIYGAVGITVVPWAR